MCTQKRAHTRPSDIRGGTCTHTVARVKTDGEQVSRTHRCCCSVWIAAAEAREKSEQNKHTNNKQLPTIFEHARRRIIFRISFLLSTCIWCFCKYRAYQVLMEHRTSVQLSFMSQDLRAVLKFRSYGCMYIFNAKCLASNSNTRTEFNTRTRSWSNFCCR